VEASDAISAKAATRRNGNRLEHGAFDQTRFSWRRKRISLSAPPMIQPTPVGARTVSSQNTDMLRVQGALDAVERFQFFAGFRAADDDGIGRGTLS